MSIDFHDLEGLTPKDRKTETIAYENKAKIIPENIKGLAFYIDALCNTRNGKKGNINAPFENLLHRFEDITVQCAWETPAKFIRNGVWGDVNVYGFYPNITFKDDLTIEALVRMTKVPSVYSPIVHHAIGGGYILIVRPNMLVEIQAYDSDAKAYIPLSSQKPLEINKPYYIIASFSNTEKKMTLTIKDYEDTLEKAIGTIYDNTTSHTIGIGTKSAKENNFNGVYSEGLSIGMVRIWNRLLINKEIEDNYKDLKERFKLV